MLRIALALIALAAHAAAAAPDPLATTRTLSGEHRLHGTVTDPSGQAIAGATVTSDAGDLAVTGIDGAFTIDLTRPAGSLTVAAEGFASRTLKPSDSLAHVELTANGELIEIVDRAPDLARPASYALDDNLRRLPGANNDALRAAQAMPGVARTPLGFGALVLRGTSPRDSSAYVDGVEVPIAFHFGGLSSFIPSGMLADARIVPGGFDASYGRAQGGIVTLTTRDPRTDRWRVAGEAGLIASGASAEGPVGNGGVMFGVRRSYLDEVAGPFVARDDPLPSYWDAQLRGAWGNPRSEGQLAPFVFASFDKIDSPQLMLDATASFVRAAVPYRHESAATSLHVVPWAGWTQVAFNNRGTTFVPEGVPPQSVTGTSDAGGVRADVAHTTAWGGLRAGVETEGGTSSRQVTTPLGPPMPVGSEVSWLDVAAWSEASVKLDADRFVVVPGLRLERYGLTGEAVVDPRLRIYQRLTDHVELRQAAGRYHQPPTPSDVDPVGGNPKLDSSYTDQASIGLDIELPASITTSVTAYYTYGRDIGVPVMNPNGGLGPQPDLGGFGPTFHELLDKELGTSTFLANLGRAVDYGVEVEVQHRSERWFGMLSYTLARARRHDAPEVDPSWHPYELDQRHRLDVAGSVHLGRWQLGGRISAASGDPYSPTSFQGGHIVVHPWAGTLPTYFELDVRADRRWHRGWGDVNLYVNLQNVTDRRNVEGRMFDPARLRDIDQPGLPLIPFIGIELTPAN